MVASIVTLEEALGQLRLEAGQDDARVTSAIAAATQLLEQHVNADLVDKHLVREYSPLPLSSDAIIVVPLSNVNAVTLTRVSDGHAESASLVRQVGYGVNATYALPPTGGWQITARDDRVSNVRWDITISTPAADPVVKAACLLLVSNIYDDAMGEMTARTIAAARNLVSGHIMRDPEPGQDYSYGGRRAYWAG